MRKEGSYRSGPWLSGTVTLALNCRQANGRTGHQRPLMGWRAGHKSVAQSRRTWRAGYKALEDGGLLASESHWATNRAWKRRETYALGSLYSERVKAAKNYFVNSFCLSVCEVFPEQHIFASAYGVVVESWRFLSTLTTDHIKQLFSSGEKLAIRENNQQL